ncbi:MULTISPECIES: hypothetical protein [Bacillus cereus group]|uniref:hypothetical protein n=1 Tax=Bacillus cereus group TaxID=86661 RepID=UPI001F59131B|nr:MULTISPECIES: hypothetical protein [Bacillus cereus group]HDD6798097.1 hypothetical protein [Staphylococcus aureus]MDH2870568.1 hypothetical protein [Bacillus cytotoxicus]HDD6800821.1 hypothetical protein [Staphylococcus aureus]HDR4573605.1 hypothetical protein [Bacillus cytotoxicus]HDR4589697.1 hypothetical protein [Bacillus cytotoxicus]
MRLTEQQLNDLKRISKLRVELFGVPVEDVADPESVEFLLDNAITSYLGQLEIFKVTIECEQYNSMCE